MKRNLMIAAVSALALSAPGSVARADIISDLKLSYIQVGPSYIYKSAWASLGEFYAALYTVNTVAEFDALVAFFHGSSSVVSEIVSSSWSSALTLKNVGLDYTIDAKGTVASDGQKLGATVEFSVPGPIAGAGIPVAAGMLGFAAWMRRRNASV